jgi:phosphatidate cytidylyltransferase
MAPAPAERRLPADLGKRAIAGIVMAVMAAVVIFLGGWYFALVMMTVLVLLALEWAKLTMGASRRRHAVVGIVLLPLLMMGLAHYWVTVAPTQTQTLFAGAVGASLLFVSLLLIRRVGGWPERLWAIVGIVYLGVPAVAFLALRDLPNGMHLVFWLVIVVVATDVFAYLVGRSVGGPKLAPRISPGKTWSGLAGGVMGALVLGGIASGLGGWGSLQGGLFAAILALVAQSGDLFESFIKRRAGVKDSGRLIPGHGGMLDRLDGYLFAAPALAMLVAVDRAL